MSAHSKLPPSSAARRVACPGSRKMEELYPREETDAAKEGTLAHEVCSMILRGELVPPGISSEMRKDCELYAHYVLGRHNSSENPLHIEETMAIKDIHPECWGTPDCWFVKDRTLQLFDFKYGFGYVDVFENWQLIEYSAGVKNDFDKAVFHIVQPRWFGAHGAIRTWEVDRPTLEGLWKKLSRSEYLAMSSHTEVNLSTECVNCKARHACPALQKSVLSQIDSTSHNIPFDLSEYQLGNELRILHRAAKLLDARITGLEAEALANIKSGKPIPHYQIGYTQPRERWAKDDAEIIALGKVLGLEIGKPPEPITPKQAMAKTKNKEIIKVLKANSETPHGSAKLQEVNEREMKQLFKRLPK